MRPYATVRAHLEVITITPTRGHRRVIRLLARVVPVLVALEAVLIVTFRLGIRPAIDAIRHFNKAVLNPAVMTMAGSAHWYASVVHHQGRTTGRAYATPVVVEQVGNQLYPTPLRPHRLRCQRHGRRRMQGRTQGHALPHRSAGDRSVCTGSPADLGAVT